jgi:hypothetical protein
VAQEHRRTMPIQQDIALQKRTEMGIVAQWARGIADQDAAAVKEAQEKRDAWNRRNPDSPIVITPNQLKQKVAGLNKDKTSRVLKSAPREMRGRIGLELMR